MAVPSFVTTTKTCNSNNATSNNWDDTSANLLQNLLTNGFFTSQQQHVPPQDQEHTFTNPMFSQNANSQATQNVMFANGGGSAAAAVPLTTSTNANCALSRRVASQQSFAANANANQVDSALALSSSILQQQAQQEQQQDLTAADPVPLPSIMSWNNANTNASNSHAELWGTQGNTLSLQGMLMPPQEQQRLPSQDTIDLSPFPMVSAPSAAASAAAVSDNDLDSSSSVNPSTNKSARFRRDQAEQWSERYDELLEFLKEHGHCRVPRNHKQYGALSSWVKRQRYQHKLRKEGKPSFLTDERVAVLDRLGFVWDSHGSVWEIRFQELQEFHKQFGHSNVPYNYNNAKLASWIKAQRREMRAFKEGKTISNEMFQRFLKLEKYGFCWQLRSSGRKSQSKQAKAVQQHH